MSRSRDHLIIIIGAGVIGLSIGWRLAQRGAPVTMFERGEAGRGASHAAAGMLAACAEVEPGEERLLALNRASQLLWPDFAAELEAASGQSDRSAHRGHPCDRADGGRSCAPAASPRIPATVSGCRSNGFGAAQVKRREPHLSPNLIGAVFSPQDHQVENRKVAAALRVGRGTRRRGDP